MLKVHFDDIETSEESMFLDAKYQGKPFTGIAFDKDKKFYYECPFVDGNAEGRCFEIFLENNKLHCETILHNGIITEERSWYPNGQLSYIFTQNPKSEQRFAEDGRKRSELVDGISKVWYDNGVMREERNYNTLQGKYYAKNGQWLFDMKLDKEWGFVTYRSNYTFNDDYIQKHALELIEEHDFYKHFLNWLPECRENFPDYKGKPVLTEVQKQIIIDMIECDNPNIKFDGICLAESFKLDEALPAIKKAVSFDVLPGDNFNDDGFPVSSYTRTVAKHAKIVLERWKYE